MLVLITIKSLAAAGKVSKPFPKGLITNNKGELVSIPGVTLNLVAARCFLCKESNVTANLVVVINTNGAIPMVGRQEMISKKA